MAGMQWRQLIWIAIGVAGMFLISRIDYHTLLDQAPALYLFGIATLLDRSGGWPFPLWRQALGSARWRLEFASVRANEVDYNHCVGSLSSAKSAQTG